jgi:hypothetical protein
MTNNKADIHSVSDIYEFPYGNFKDLLQAEQKKEVIIGAAMDFARQWVTSGDKRVPGFGKFMVHTLTLIMFLLPIALIVFSILTAQYLLLINIIPMVMSFIILRPMSVRATPFLKLIIFANYILIVLGIFHVLGAWAIYLGLSMNLIWLLNKFVYSISTDTTLNASRNNEKLFVYLFKANVLGLQFPDGKMVWGYDFFKKD